MEVPTFADANSRQSSSSDRSILIRVGDQPMAFPSAWLSEVLLIKQSQILSLPFYAPMMLGVIHHNGSLVPLLSARQVLNYTIPQADLSSSWSKSLTVLRMNAVKPELAGVGIVVEQLLGRRAEDKNTQIPLFPLESIPATIWQPLR